MNPPLFNQETPTTDYKKNTIFLVIFLLFLLYLTFFKNWQAFFYFVLPLFIGLGPVRRMIKSKVNLIQGHKYLNSNLTEGLV